MFITEEDYKVVIGDAALKVITQTDEANRANAEAEAIEEMSGYLRPNMTARLHSPQKENSATANW